MNKQNNLAQDSLQRVAARLRAAGASAQHVPAHGTFDQSTIAGLSIALCLLDGENAGTTLTTLRSDQRAAGTAPAQRIAGIPAGPFDFIVNLAPGEVYVGLMTAAGGKPLHHLILLPGEAEKVTWAEAKEFAIKAGGELPTRAEQSVLFGNAEDEFLAEWYWSNEQHAASGDCAWSQGFDYGYQDGDYESARLRARAVRRLSI